MAELLASFPVTRRLPRGRHGVPTGPAGVTVGERPMRVATVAARKGATVATIERLGALLGTVPQDRPAAVTAGGVTLVGIGPGRWTAVSESVADLEAALGPTLDGVASVIDQSGGQIAFEVSGPGVGDLLAALVAIDLAPEVFPVGSAATTSVAHVGVTLWRGETAWTFLVGRSFAVAFERAVVASAARLGVVLA